jgi:benzoylformate decarboxylase
VLDLPRAFGHTAPGNPGSTELPMFRDFPADFRHALRSGVDRGRQTVCAGASKCRARQSHWLWAGHALGNLFTAYRNQTPSS